MLNESRNSKMELEILTEKQTKKKQRRNVTNPLAYSLSYSTNTC